MNKKFKIGLVSLKEGDNCPPIGIVSIGTYLKKHLGEDIDVKIIDRNFEDIEAVIKSSGFDLIGISAMTVHYGKALRLARSIKTDTRIPVVLGGVHISTLPVSFEDCFDIGVIGEGEESLLEIIKCYLGRKIARKEDLAVIKGLLFLDQDKLVRTEERPLIANLDDLPLPDWSLIDRRYFSQTASTTFGEFGVEGSILTSRGCPYKCLFCSTTKFWQKLRFHSAEYVLEQMRDIIVNYKCTHIQIWDDLFTINRPRLLKISELLKKEHLLNKRIKFNCQPRPNLVNDELCRVLKSMNIELAIFGFETGSEKVLKFLKRGTVTVKDNKKAILCCRKNGIKVQGSVVLGSPGETIEDMRQTLDFVDFAIKNKVQRLWSFVLTPFPCTEIWDIAKERGKVCDKGFDWDSLFHQNIDRPLLLDEGVDLKEFKKIFEEIRKRIIWFRLKKIVSFFLNNPFKTVAFALKNPFNSLYLLFTRKDV